MKWYRVELHTHTNASDGYMNPKDLVENSIDRKYKAIVVTDHNTTSNNEDVIKYGKEHNFLVIEGIEWTTFFGHIVVTGGNSKVDWRDINKENIDKCIKEAKDSGDVITIAHPKRLGNPFCSGCYFDYDIKHWENVAAIEIWSKYMVLDNKIAKESKNMWANLVNEGYKIAPVYGYDWHDKDEGCPPYAMTYLGVEGPLNKNNFLDAIKNRHTYVTMGVNVDCSLENEKGIFYPGDEIKADKYTLKIKAKVEEDYFDKYETKIEGFRIYGNNKLYMAKKWNGEELEIEIQLCKGNFRIELYGEVENKLGEIAILSPYYIID